MIRTASTHRVALEYAYRQDRMVRRAYFRRIGMDNLLSVEVPLDAKASDWGRFDDPYGRDFDSAVDDLKDVGRRLGLGDVEQVTDKGNRVTFYVKYRDGMNEEKAQYNLEKSLTERLKEMARDDEGLAVLLYGMGGGGRFPSIAPESEVWAG